MELKHHVLFTVTLCLALALIVLMGSDIYARQNHNPVQPTIQPVENVIIKEESAKPEVEVKPEVVSPNYIKTDNCCKRPFFRGFRKSPGIIKRIIERRRSGYGIFQRKFCGFYLFRCR